MKKEFETAPNRLFISLLTDPYRPNKQSLKVIPTYFTSKWGFRPIYFRTNPKEN